MTVDTQMTRLPSMEIMRPYSTVAWAAPGARFWVVKKVYSTMAKARPEAASEMVSLNLNSVLMPSTAMAARNAATGNTGVLKPAIVFPSFMLAQGRMLPTANRRMPAKQTSLVSTPMISRLRGPNYYKRVVPTILRMAGNALPSGKRAEQHQIRIAVIDYDRCNPQGCGGYLCERVCPVNRMDKKCIVHEPEQKPVISEELCIDCQICVIKCPFHAISIVSLTAKLDEPIHQYGVNSFRVYRLPYPRPGSVVGLIGVNGIGKTTVLRALAGQLVPNLGDYSKPASYDQLVEHFRGKEIQGFFKQARDRGLKFSYKPQNMDDLPKVVKGKVEALLRKVDERKQFEAVVESLNLSKVLDRELRQLSGGELQRVAIAASALKDADLYAFDEPSSYLDVSERLRMARVLKGLTANNKSVLVIEHDLAVLDYLSDYVHILFGKKGTYGVVSNPKTCKNGINEFLQGFIPDENLRFRARELRFEVRPPHDAQKRRLVAEFPAMHKSFKGFKLSTEGGDLCEGEVIGVLGPNGIGKTTFVKLLARP